MKHTDVICPSCRKPSPVASLDALAKNRPLANIAEALRRQADKVCSLLFSRGMVDGGGVVEI